MRSSRSWNQIREPRITPDFCPASLGSALIEMGGTKVICAVSLDREVPEHASAKGKGWLTAEYSLLPYSTSGRTPRPLLKRDGRAVEIQRLLGRVLRGAIDLQKIPGYSLTVDCDVLQADGGTRTAAITGGYIALRKAARAMVERGMIADDPVSTQVAAISVGIVDGKTLLDLDFSEDSAAAVDLNVVMDGSLNLIEIQGTGEKSAFSRAELNAMVDLAAHGIGELLDIQKKY